MKITMRLFILALVVGFVQQSGVAGTVLGTEGKKCYPTSLSRSSGSTISVFGDWIENISTATSPAGVTVTIVDKFNGLQNNTPGDFKGRGKVSLRINTSNATPGNKTISLNNGSDIFTFTITVIAAATVTSVDVQKPDDPFREITVTLNGTGLKNASVAARVVSNISVPNSTGLITTNVDVLSSSTSMSLQARISFSRLINDATVELSLRSTDDCSPLNVYNYPLFIKTVRVRSNNRTNYVQSITLPQGDILDAITDGTIKLTLLFPEPLGASNSGITSAVSATGLQGGVKPTTGNAIDNKRVFIKFDPDVMITQRNGLPFPKDANGFSVVNTTPGMDNILIQFRAGDCSRFIGSSDATREVKIKTWMHGKPAEISPNYLEKSFSIRCR